MAADAQEWSTAIAQVMPDDVLVRGKLLSDIVGRRTFTEVVFLEIVGRFAEPGEREMLDAVLVSLVEHGISPSSMITRMLVSCGTPVQAALAGGLLSIADWHGGSGEQVGALFAALLERETASVGSLDEQAREMIVAETAGGARLPGYGHPQHPDGDPRAETLLGLAEHHGVSGAHCRAARALERGLSQVSGKSVPLNVTGAIAAVLLDLGFPVRSLRGVGIGARAFGLTAHAVEELEQGGRWRHVDAAAVGYTGPSATAEDDR